MESFSYSHPDGPVTACSFLCSSSRPWTVFVAQTGLLIFQPQPLNCCDYRCALQCPAQKFLLNGFAQWDIVRNKCWCQDPSLNKVVSNRIQGWEALDTGKKDKVAPPTPPPAFDKDFAFVSVRNLLSRYSRCVWFSDRCLNMTEPAYISEKAKGGLSLGYLKSPCTCLIRSIIFFSKKKLICYWL